MRVLTISGSSRPGSQNIRLLQALPHMRPSWEFEYFDIATFPLFKDLGEAISYPSAVTAFKKSIQSCNVLIISTPEYIHSIPAQLKNALEWVTASGELENKTTLPIVFAPHVPRGEKAMNNLLNALKAMKANVLTHLHLYQVDCTWDVSENIVGSTELLELLNAALDLIEK